MHLTDDAGYAGSPAARVPDAACAGRVGELLCWRGNAMARWVTPAIAAASHVITGGRRMDRCQRRDAKRNAHTSIIGAPCRETT